MGINKKKALLNGLKLKKITVINIFLIKSAMI